MKSIHAKAKKTKNSSTLISFQHEAITIHKKFYTNQCTKVFLP